MSDEVFSLDDTELEAARENAAIQRDIDRRKAGYITDAVLAIDNKKYVVFAIGARPDKSTYVYNPQIMSGWEFKRLRRGCYTAIELPEWKE